MDSKPKQSTTKGNRKKISELSSFNHIDAIESWV